MDTEARFIELETRLAFQEKALGDMGMLVHRQRQELDALRRIVAQASADLLALRDSLGAGPADEPPPPHY